MNSDGDGPSKLPPESKGKGRQNGGTDDLGQSTPSSSLLRGVMQSARSSVTPSNLSSLMAANGKSASLGALTQTPEQMFRDTKEPQSALQSSQIHSNGFRSASDFEEQGRGDAYRDFAEMGASRIDLGIHEALRSSSPAFVGPYSSAQSLDAALHDQVRASTSQWNGMEEAWTARSSLGRDEQTEGPLHPGYDEAWAQTMPRVPMARADELQRGADIDNLLQTVSLSDQPSPLAPPAQSNGRIYGFMDMLDDEEHLIGAPYSEDDGMMSEEQADLHHALDDLHQSEDRADERIRPPDDDAVARTGVYAATPQEALQAIWDGSAEGDRASSVLRDSQVPGETVPRKIRELLKRGSYVDDVYGIPPQLQKTIVDAEEPETEENRDRRAKAIARLGALYRHLGASSSEATSIDDFVRDW